MLLLGAIMMYGKIHANEHVNSSPIGMGTLCSTLCHLPYITNGGCVSTAEPFAVYSVAFLHHLPSQEAVIESASLPTCEFSLVSVKKQALSYGEYCA